jgi:hypothetical protein
MIIAPDDPLDHGRVIAFPAKSLTTPIDEIARLYAHEWATLDAGSRLKGFIPCITFGHVRSLLRKLSVKVPTRLSRVHVPIAASSARA